MNNMFEYVFFVKLNSFLYLNRYRADLSLSLSLSVKLMCTLENISNKY